MTPTKGDEVREIMNRTMANLRFIDCQKALGTNVFEVTQLINSFLGALALPWEKYESQLNQMALASPPSNRWQSIKNELPAGTNPASVGLLIKKLRNAVLHGNIEFRPEHPAEIDSVILWNTPNGKMNRTWQTTLNLTDIKAALEEFVTLANELS
jgi:hypothetical protein